MNVARCISVLEHKQQMGVVGLKRVKGRCGSERHYFRRLWITGRDLALSEKGATID